MRYSSDTTYELVRAHETDAGVDLVANEDVIIPAGSRHLVKTGFRVELPAGTVGLVCPRSGLAAKHGVTVLNSSGVIDQGYTGEIGVILVNHGRGAHYIAKGDRIAQLLVMPVLTPVLERVDSIDEKTERGTHGFGSSGY